MLSRRTFLLSAAAATATLPTSARAAPRPGAGRDGASPTVLRLQRRNIEVNGKAASVYGIRQPNGTFGIRTEVGKRFRVRVENGIEEPSLIHWHGLTPPWQQDGVPGVSGPPIPPGGSADYDFPLRFGGTYWMHSHQGLQEQLLMSAPLIIRDQRDRPDQQEVVVMLADFSFTPPEQIFERLRKGGSMPSMTGAAAPAPASMTAMSPPEPTMAPGMAMGAASAKPDLNDVKYDAFIANDRTLADPDVVKVEPGGRVLLRIINSSSMSAFHRRSRRARRGAHRRRRVSRSRRLVARRFPLAVAQRLDIRLAIPRAPGAHPVLAVLEGESSQTGIVLRAGQAPIVAHPRHRRRGVAGAHARPRASPARAPTAQAAQGRPRPYPRPDRSDVGLRLVAQQCRLEQGCPAATGREGGACRARLRQPHAHAPSDAPARA